MPPLKARAAIIPLTGPAPAPRLRLPREGKPMSFASEFREFAVKGNVVDLAVGVIIGAAFGKIVESLVTDLVMPVIGRLTRGIDFASHFFALAPVPPGIPLTLEAVRKAGIPVLAWGNVINIAFNFIILA